MNKLKLIFVSIIGAACAVSCLKGSYYEVNAVVFNGFEFDNIISAMGDDSVYVEGNINDNYMLFCSARPAQGEELTGGFALTMKKDTLYAEDGYVIDYENNPYPEFTAYGTRTRHGDNTCAVFLQDDDHLMPGHDIAFGSAAYGTCSPQSCYINNTLQTISSILADGQTKFAKGDYLKLTIKGIRGGNETGSVQYYLADYRNSADGQPDSLLTRWKNISLSNLGQVDYIDFSLESTKGGFPLTVCLDNLISAVYIKR